MGEKLKDRQYGKHGWISIADTQYDPVEDEKITWPDRKEVLAKLKISEETAKSNYQKMTPWQKMRERWRALCIECRKKGIDSLLWEEYKEIWDTAGEVELLEGLMVPAHKLQKKFYQKEFRTVMARVDETSGIGFRPGNVVVLAIEGAWRNHRKFRYPKSFDILSFWRENGEVVVPEGKEKEALEEVLLSVGSSNFVKS